MQELNVDCLLIICHKLTVQEWTSLTFVCKKIRKLMDEIATELFQETSSSMYNIMLFRAERKITREMITDSCYEKQIPVLNYISKLYPYGIEICTTDKFQEIHDLISDVSRKIRVLDYSFEDNICIVIVFTYRNHTCNKKYFLSYNNDDLMILTDSGGNIIFSKTETTTGNTIYFLVNIARLQIPFYDRSGITKVLYLQVIKCK
jgi:hypothetical protein